MRSRNMLRDSPTVLRMWTLCVHNFLSVSGNTSCALSCAWLKQTDFFFCRVANSKLWRIQNCTLLKVHPVGSVEA